MMRGDMGETVSRTDRKRTVPGFVPAETAFIGGNCGICETVHTYQ
jgi:hypothetical protein